MGNEGLHGLHWRASRRVGFHEAGPDGCVRLDVLADWLQDVGADHADALDLATDTLRAKGIAWALRRLTLHLERLPAMGETVAVDTWPAGRDRMFFHRDFRLLGTDGRPLAVANARWGLFDVDGRKAMAIPDWMADKVAVDPQRAADFASGPVPALGDGAVETDRAVPPRWTDVDLNGHVNNARLVGWLLEGLPRDVVARSRLTAVDVAFRRECLLDDPVASRSFAVDDGTYRHALVHTETGNDIARAETRWTAA